MTSAVASSATLSLSRFLSNFCSFVFGNKYYPLCSSHYTLLYNSLQLCKLYSFWFNANSPSKIVAHTRINFFIITNITQKVLQQICLPTSSLSTLSRVTNLSVSVSWHPLYHLRRDSQTHSATMSSSRTLCAMAALLTLIALFSTPVSSGEHHITN